MLPKEGAIVSAGQLRSGRGLLTRLAHVTPAFAAQSCALSRTHCSGHGCPSLRGRMLKTDPPGAASSKKGSGRQWEPRGAQAGGGDEADASEQRPQETVAASVPARGVRGRGGATHASQGTLRRQSGPRPATGFGARLRCGWPRRPWLSLPSARHHASAGRAGRAPGGPSPPRASPGRAETPHSRTPDSESKTSHACTRRDTRAAHAHACSWTGFSLRNTLFVA